MLSLIRTKLFILSMLSITPVLVAAGPPDVVDSGHHPIEVRYQGGEWSFFVDATESARGRLDPASTVYHFSC
jgi:hypothetical protein